MLWFVSMPNVAMIRDYGWRGGCPAAGVTDAGEGAGQCLAAFECARSGSSMDIPKMIRQPVPVRFQACVMRRVYAGPLPSFPDRQSTRLNSSHLGISYAVF